MAEEHLAHDLDTMADLDAYNAWLVDRATPWVRGRVLDAGAGIGTHTARLAKLADEVVALEPEPDLATLLRTKLPNVKVIQSDATGVDGPFDTILCFNVLEHIADDEGTLARFHELLAAGGALLLIVPAHQALFGTLDKSFGHERRYGKTVLRDRLVRAGFEIEELRHVNPVGALGWFVQGRILHADNLPDRGTKLYDKFVPVFKALDRVPVPVGLSLWAVAKIAGSATPSAMKT